MDSWEFTKIAAAVLSALLVIFGLRTAIEISEASAPKIVGYKLPVKEVAAVDPSKGGVAAPAWMAFDTVKPLLATASAEDGQAVFKQCLSCHTPTKGGANGTGPNIWGIVGRANASVAGFNYSEPAKAKAADKWTYQNLAGFVSAPAAYMPGTKMLFKGVAEPKKMADLLAYLRTLSDAPVDLPK
jgi:cytochrome c